MGIPNLLSCDYRSQANHKGIEGEHRAQRARVRRWREEHTLIQRQSWGPSNDSGLKMVNWESQSKTTHQSPEDGHIDCILLVRIAFCHVSENLPLCCLFLRYYKHLFQFSMLILHVTSSRFCLYLLNIYHFTHTFSHAHTEAHTHKHTCTISTQEEWRQPGTEAWLRGVQERLLLETKALHTKRKKEIKCQEKNLYSRL